MKRVDDLSIMVAPLAQVGQQAGIVPKVEMDLDSVEASKHMVELGQGIAWLPRARSEP